MKKIDINQKATLTIAEAIEKYVKQYTQKLSYDITEQGIITEVLGNNNYLVQIKGTAYTVPCAIDQLFNVNDNVLVLYVQGDASRKYIIGEGK